VLDPGRNGGGESLNNSNNCDTPVKDPWQAEGLALLRETGQLGALQAMAEAATARRSVCM
jgi:hypothetical protein